MGIGNQLLFFFAALGVFNGFLLTIYFLFIKKPRRWVNVLFGLLLLMLCIRIGKSIFIVFAEVARVYRQIALSACIMVGPLLYVYLKTLLNGTNTLKRSDYVHLILPSTTIVLAGIIWPYETRPEVWNNTMVQLIYAVWILYMLFCLSIMIPLFRKLGKTRFTIIERWSMIVFSCVLALCIAYNLALRGFPYLAGPLLFSLVLYIMMVFLASKKNRTAILLDHSPKYQKQRIDDIQAQDLLQRLDQMMEQEQPFLNPKIKLAAIAALIGAGPHEVSQVINDRRQMSFNQYINEYRIRIACNLLQEENNLTLEGIGQEVGFSSRSAFYNAFKAVMGQTPGQYKNEKQEPS